jgi:hypothetical protein
VSRKTGTVMNKNELVYPDRALLKFTGAGETGDWKLLKVGQFRYIRDLNPD